MRLATVTADGESRCAVLADGVWRALPAPDFSAMLRTTAPGGLPSPGPVLRRAVQRLPLPTPSKVVCCGLNYGEHIAETGRDRPAYPTLFAKHADTLIGPVDDVVLPAGLDVDWEAELAVVVGTEIRHADRATAGDAIAGYTVANDISVRDWQYRTVDWFQGKAWDATTPIGPVVVTPDEVDPAAGVDVVCRVNGEEVQRDSTRTLVFDPAALLSYISTFTVLRPGDLVLTGTPGGIGATRTPPRFLADGDVVETEIEGIGVLRNTVRLIARPTHGQE